MSYFFKTLIFRSRARSSMRRFQGSPFRGVLYDKPLDIELKQLCTKIGDIELELIQPGEEESPWKDFLDSKGEGIQHLGFKVDDLKDVIAKLVKQGASVFVTGKARGRLQAAYVDLGVGDIIVELMEF